MTMTNREIEDWNRFVREGMPADFDDIGSNVIADFSKMCKKFGKAYLDYLKIAYSCKGDDSDMTDAEFCRINGNIPVPFFEKMKKEIDVQKIPVVNISPVCGITLKSPENFPGGKIDQLIMEKTQEQPKSINEGIK